MSGIRVTYTGFVSFFIAIITIVSSSIFTLIITRTLSQEEYGTWTLILSLIIYVSMVGPIVSYWSTRDTARNIQSGKTAILSTMILSIVAISSYIVISSVMGYYANIEQNVLLFATILIPLIFLNGILSAINLGWKPQIISVGTLAFGLSEIPLALFFVFYLDLGVIGLILTVLIAYMISIIILFYAAREKIKNQFKISYLKKWFKISWLPLYTGIPIIVAGFDVSVFTIITSSVMGLAIWGAAIILPSMISHTAVISRAVYPKLLGQQTQEFVNENLTHLFYFGILFTAVIITFARPVLFVLNPIYEIGFPVVIIMAFAGFFTVLTNVFLLSLAGVENVDKYENSRFKDYIRSKLFFPQTIRLIQTSFYIIVLTIGLMILFGAESTNLELLIFWACLALITQVPLTLYLYYLLKKNITIKLQVKRIIKYLLTSIGVFSMTYVLTDNFLIYDNAVVSFLPNLLAFVIFGASLYIIITYLVDKTIRNLAHSIIDELKTKLS